MWRCIDAPSRSAVRAEHFLIQISKRRACASYHRAVTRRLLAAALLGTALLVPTGCAIAPDGIPAEPAVRTAREEAMNARWRNHTLAELVRVRGAPRDTMTIPGGGNPIGFITVYERDPESGCVDAFAFMDGPEPVIRNYYCR